MKMKEIEKCAISDRNETKEYEFRRAEDDQMDTSKCEYLI